MDSLHNAVPASILGTLPPDEDRGNIINIVMWVGVSISTLAVIIRAYTRARVTHTMGWEDALLIASVVLNITASVLVSVAITLGLGRHIYYITDDFTRPLLFLNVAQPIEIAASCLPKLAVAVLIVQLMGAAAPFYGVIALYGVVAVLFVSSIPNFILLFAQCDTHDGPWHISPADQCLRVFLPWSFWYFAACELRSFNSHSCRQWAL
jgi:hypothetical protein